MLVADPKWCFIDLRPRARRRIAVIATYVAMLAILAFFIVHPRGDGGVLLSWMLVFALSPLSWHRIVQGAGRMNPLAERVLRWLLRGAYRRTVSKGKVPTNLKMIAMRVYRKRYEDLDQAQQAEAGRLLEAHLRGEYLPQFGPTGGLGLIDERLVQQEEHIDAITLKIIRQLLFAAFLLFILFDQAAMIDTRWLSRLLVVLVILTTTLPRAIAMWQEPDPRDLTGPELLA